MACVVGVVSAEAHTTINWILGRKVYETRQQCRASQCVNNNYNSSEQSTNNFNATEFLNMGCTLTEKDNNVGPPNV